MSFLGRWISGGSLWFTSRLARIFSLPGWLWLLGFQGGKRTVGKDVENGQDVLSDPTTTQPQEGASVGIVGHGVVETTNDLIKKGELVSSGASGNVKGKNMEGQDVGNGQDEVTGRPDLAITQPEKATIVDEVESKPTKYEFVMDQKGEFIDGGASGIIEQLPSGDVVKSPWASNFDECCKSMTIEAQIYEILGAHQRLVKIVDWNSETCCLTMEYMPNGNLKGYLRAHNDKISTIQRLRWILEAAEGLQLLHSADIMHCDVEPKNFLLDEHLSLRISDFSGSSIKGTKPLAHASVRFSHPSYEWRYVPTIQDDIFALGSTIHTIITGLYPFQEMDSLEVVKRYEAHEWADVTGILCGEIIERCWRSEIASAQEIYDAVQEKIKTIDKLEIS